MFRALCLALILVVAAAWLAPSKSRAQTSEAAAAPRPNFVLIVADDLGYGDLGSYGNRVIRTPSLDALAAEGLRMTDFHASDSVCTPSRAGLLTGRYAQRMALDVPLHPEHMSWKEWLVVRAGYLIGRIGLMDLATEGGATGLPEEELTLAETLGAVGYATAMVGKWHLGDYAINPAHDPRNHGFDHYLGVPYSNDMTPFPLYRDGERLEENITDQSKLTKLYTDDAVTFIEASRDRPFFLYFAHTFPHRPLFASESFRNRSEAGLYGDVVEEIDASVGEIVAALERAGAADNTVIVFTSDNGPWYQGSPGLFRGRKGQTYEGGHRVPMLVRWPRGVPRGSVSTALASNLDVFPTFVALAGAAGPQDRVVDGKDITRLLTHPSSPSPHAELYLYHHGDLEGVRSGPWKYFRSLNHYVWPGPVNKKLGFLSPHTTGPLPLLFNLEIDPGESYDLSSRRADVAARSRGTYRRVGADAERQQDGSVGAAMTWSGTKIGHVDLIVTVGSAAVVLAISGNAGGIPSATSHFRDAPIRAAPNGGMRYLCNRATARPFRPTMGGCRRSVHSGGHGRPQFRG